jgi:hypothetical protein
MELNQAATGNEKDYQTASDGLERDFWSGVFGNADSKRLIEIGNELNKVRMYANERKVDDIRSQTVVHLALSAYFAGVSPLIRIESSLLVAKSLGNEYAFALAVRAYIEVAGRIHKGVRLWRNHQKGCFNMDQLSENIGRLLARFRPKNAERIGVFKGDGYNVMTLVQSLKDEIPDIEDMYDNLSSYVHGGFEEQMFFRKQAWLSHLKGESNPVVAKFEPLIMRMREIAFTDFEALLEITRVFRDRYDIAQKLGEENGSLP